jgi:Flp pilus assembly pilin Flp
VSPSSGACGTPESTAKRFQEADMQRIDVRCEQGQTMAEYGVILAVITVGVVAALIMFSGAIVSALERTSSLIQ